MTPTRYLIAVTTDPDLLGPDECWAFYAYPATDDWCEMGDHALTSGDALYPAEGGAPPACAPCLLYLPGGTLYEVTREECDTLASWQGPAEQPNWRTVAVSRKEVTS